MTAAESATNGIAPNAVNAMSKLASPNGRCWASAWTSGTSTPVLVACVRAWRSMPADRSKATGRAPWPASQREHIAAPQPTSRICLPATVAEQVRVGLTQVLRAPHEVGCSEEFAVFAVVLVSVAIPPAPIRADRHLGVSCAAAYADRAGFSCFRHRRNHLRRRSRTHRRSSIRHHNWTRRHNPTRGARRPNGPLHRCRRRSSTTRPCSTYRRNRADDAPRRGPAARCR